LKVPSEFVKFNTLNWVVKHLVSIENHIKFNFNKERFLVEI